MTIPSCTDDLLAEIEAAAKAATPGQWGADGSFVCTARTEGGTTYVETWSGVSDANRVEDARYIAKANPANVLALTARVRELEKDAARYRWLRENAKYQLYGDQIIDLFSCSAHKADRLIDSAMKASP